MAEPPPDNAFARAVSIAKDLLAGDQFLAPALVKNLAKALSRLCTAAVDVPVAHLEGPAAEKRAETSARVLLQETTAQQIADRMRVDPEYASRAVRQFGQRILREQVNLDMVARRTVAELEARQQPREPTDDELNDDWLHAFETVAREKSTEEMRTYFARVLAGEVARPGSFSIRALRILGNLTSPVARLFRRLCALSVAQEQIGDMRVLSLGSNAATNALAEHGLPFGDLNLLNEYGLIIADYHSWRDYQICIGVSASSGPHAEVLRRPLVHQQREWVLLRNPVRPAPQELKLHGVAFTSAGTELARIVDPEPTPAYTEKLTAFFRQRGLEMVEHTPDRRRRSNGATAEEAQ